jgi:hypothetical protein
MTKLVDVTLEDMHRLTGAPGEWARWEVAQVEHHQRLIDFIRKHHGTCEVVKLPVHDRHTIDGTRYIRTRTEVRVPESVAAQL